MRKVPAKVMERGNNLSENTTTPLCEWFVSKQGKNAMVIVPTMGAICTTTALKIAQQQL